MPFLVFASPQIFRMVLGSNMEISVVTVSPPGTCQVSTDAKLVYKLPGIELPVLTATTNSFDIAIDTSRKLLVPFGATSIKFCVQPEETGKFSFLPDSSNIQSFETVLLRNDVEITNQKYSPTKNTPPTKIFTPAHSSSTPAHKISTQFEDNDISMITSVPPAKSSSKTVPFPQIH